MIDNGLPKFLSNRRHNNNLSDSDEEEKEYYPLPVNYDTASPLEQFRNNDYDFNFDFRPKSNHSFHNYVDERTRNRNENESDVPFTTKQNDNSEINFRIPLNEEEKHEADVPFENLNSLSQLLESNTRNTKINSKSKTNKKQILLPSNSDKNLKVNDNDSLRELELLQRHIELNTNGTVDHNDKEGLTVARKQTTSYTFMGSNVIENVNKAHLK